jgi:hypothetical protein
MELDGHLLNPLGIEIVVDDFSLPDALPHVALLPVKDGKRVTFRECVHVQKFFARKVELQSLDKSVAPDVACS